MAAHIWRTNISAAPIEMGRGRAGPEATPDRVVLSRFETGLPHHVTGRVRAAAKAGIAAASQGAPIQAAFEASRTSPSEMTRRQRRLTLIGAVLGTVALAIALVLIALKDSIVFFNSPSDLVEKHVAAGQRMRVGGLVREGSLRRGENLAVRFMLTDGSHEVSVAYRGQLPDLFREGQGVVAEGALDASGTFQADTILAKHDERYMPKEVADALKKQGHWQGEDQKHERAVRESSGDR